MARPKIAMVGGGSYNWCPRLVADIMNVEQLSNADFRLLDINKDASDLVAGVVKRSAEKMGVGATFLSTTDPARALDGADFVVITISTGGFDAMEHDLKIPERYGIYMTVGDSAGPGGWARGLRNIPVFKTLAEQTKKYCPRAFILNYTNPMATLTQTMTLVTDQPVVGLCHGFFENLRHLMNIFKLKDESQISARYAGINHFFWILDFTIDGKPGYPMLRRKLGKKKRIDDLVRDAYTDEAGHASIRRLVASELFEEFGYMPYLGDRHTTEFFSRYLAPDQSRLKKYGIVRTTIGERRKRMKDRRKQCERWASGRDEMDTTRTRETAADIMAARVAHREFVDVMNLPNTGQVSNLPLGPVVETPGLVNASGFQPIGSVAMPPQLVNLTTPHMINNQLIVEAGLEGDWDKAYYALINDPLCSHLSIPKIKEMGRKLLEANRKHLPQFFGRRGK